MPTHHADVAFLAKCQPGLIHANAKEFARMDRVLQSVEPDVRRAGDITWQSVAREHYDARLAELLGLVTNLAAGFRTAGPALHAYADALGGAIRHYGNGVDAEAELGRLMWQLPRVATGDMSREPMRQFESAAGFFQKRPGDSRIDTILESARRLYGQADESYSTARESEQAARNTCLAGLDAARNAMPDFLGDFRAMDGVLPSVQALAAEAVQARRNGDVRLPGAGDREQAWPADVDGAVSNKLAEIRAMAASFYPTGERGDEWEWLRNNRQLIEDVARRTGLPPEMLAGILLNETDEGGVDDLKETGREWGLLPGHPDQTTFGPMQIQIHTAADVLGYDPENLTDDQRDAIRGALTDPVQSVFIAAEYLERLKAGSDFADKEPDQWDSDEDYRELAGQYNRGPHAEPSEGNEAYADEFMGRLDRVRAIFT